MKNHKLKKIFLLCLCLSFSMAISAKISVSGIVNDENGNPLIGVNVRLFNNLKVGTVTETDGTFTLSVNAETDVLIFTYLGYVTVEKLIPVSEKLIVTMQEESNALNDVVVVGYQNIRRRDMTGAVAKADVSEMLKAPVPNFDQALGGRVAGVNASSSSGMPGESVNIVIRGNNSITQANSPLFIVDGFPVEDPDYSSSLNPNDIESIDVLKDASAAAIYGSRGANGVIIITTKKGKIGETQINYDFNGGVQRAINEIPLMDAYEFVKLQAELYPNEMAIPGYGYFSTYEEKTWALEDYRNIEQYKWQDMILQDAWQQSHNLSLRGGSPQIRYNTSLSVFDQDGIVKRSNYNKIQGRSGVQYSKDKLTMEVNVNYNRITTYGNNPAQNSYTGQNNLFYNVWGYRPVTQPGKPLISLLEELDDDKVDPANDYRMNPYMNLMNEHVKSRVTFMQADAFAVYNFAKGLKLKVSGSYSSYLKLTENFYNSKTRNGYPGSTNGVFANLGHAERNSWLNENLLMYQKTIDRVHNINGFLGITFQESASTYSNMGTKQLPNESLGIAGMGQGMLKDAAYSVAEWGMLSSMGRFNYDYQSKYYLTVSLRADASSKFSKEYRWGYFPSGSTAWSFMEEPFLAAIKPVVNMGKLRVSWGLTGNNRIGEYDRFATMGAFIASQGNMSTSSGIPHSLYPVNNNTSLKGTIPTSLPNNSLRWETTSQTDIGLDLFLLKDRIKISTDWYDKVTSDLLLFSNLPLSSGYAGAMKNIGSVGNRGFEFTIQTINIRTKGFKWSSDFNISFNRNQVISLTENEESMLSYAVFDQTFNTMPSYIAKIGYPIGMMYGYIYEGTYKLSDFDDLGGLYKLKGNIPYFTTEVNTQPGYPRYQDLNRDGIINASDRTMIGCGDPKHIGGLTNNFEFKGFDLSVFLQWSYGGNVMNANRLMFESAFNSRRDLNQYATYINRWTFDNPQSDIPRASLSTSNMVFSTRVVEDASYLRIKDVSLGYTLPVLLMKRVGIERARVFVSAHNLCTFTKYTGFDPEVSIRHSALTPGLDFSSYPRAASLHLGLNLSF